MEKGRVDLRLKLYKMSWGVERALLPNPVWSWQVYEGALARHVGQETVWLDLGCGHQLFPPWRAQQEKQLVANCRMIVGIDYDLPSLRKHEGIRRKVRGDIARLPFRDDVFDLVTSNMVVEHLQDPENQFREIHRILKPGGFLIFHTPNAHGYPTILARMVPEGLKRKLILLLEGRKEEDVFRTYYRANTTKKIEWLAGRIGFGLEQIQTALSTPVFMVLPPLVVFEYLLMRVFRARRFDRLRPNLVAVLTKSPASAPAASASNKALASAEQ